MPDEYKDYAVYFTELVMAFCEQRIDSFNVNMPEMGLASVCVRYHGNDHDFKANTVAEAMSIALDAMPQRRPH